MNAWIIFSIFIFILVLIVSLYFLGYIKLSYFTVFYVIFFIGYFGFLAYELYYIYQGTLPVERTPLQYINNIPQNDDFTTLIASWFTFTEGPTLSRNPEPPTNNRTPRMTEIYVRNIEQIREAYKLGFRLELGEPTEKWISEAKAKLERLGPKNYYKIIQENNKIRINSLVTHGVTLHEEDTMMESIYNYNSFDLIESLENGHLFAYTRIEWDWILKNKICPYSRTPIPDIVLRTIEVRNKIAIHLPEIIALGNGILNENSSSQKSENSSIQKLSNYISPKLEISPIDPNFAVPESIIENAEILGDLENIPPLDNPLEIQNSKNTSYIGLYGISELQSNLE